MPDFFLSPQQKFPVTAHLIICQTKFNNSIISRPNDGYASLNWVLIGSGNYGSSPLKFCTKPLTEAILINSQLNSWEYISMKFEMKFLIFLRIKCISKCHLQNFSHFVPTSIMLIQSVCTSPYLYNKTARGGTRSEKWWGCAAGRWKLDPKRSREKWNLGPKRSYSVRIGSFNTTKDRFGVGGWEKIPQKYRARSCQSEKRGSKPRHICITHHIGSTPPPPPPPPPPGKTVSRLHTKAIHRHINALHMSMSPCTITQYLIFFSPHDSQWLLICLPASFYLITKPLTDQALICQWFCNQVKVCR